MIFVEWVFVRILFIELIIIEMVSVEIVLGLFGSQKKTPSAQNAEGKESPSVRKAEGKEVLLCIKPKADKTFGA